MRNEEQDLMILAGAFFRELVISNCEYGGIGLDCKRPFGNSDVEGDMLELLECEPEGDDGEDKCWSSSQREYVSGLYHEKLIPFLRAQWELKVSNAKVSGAGTASAGLPGYAPAERTKT